MFDVIAKKHCKIALLALSLMVSACGIQSSSNTVVPTQKEENLLQLARASESARDISQSVRLYKQAIDISKGSVEAHMGLANLYDRKNMRDKALLVMRDAKKIQPNHPIINAQLGDYYTKQGNVEKALTYFNDGLKESPNNSTLLNGKGLALDTIGNHSQAQTAYNQGLINAYDAQDELLYNLAISYMLTGHYDKAITHLNSIDPKSIAIRKNLAVAYALKGNNKQSQKWRGKDISKTAVNKSTKFYRDYLKALKN